MGQWDVDPLVPPHEARRTAPQAGGSKLAKKPKALLFRWRDAFMGEDGPHTTTRYVLLALSMHMDGDGSNCYPSVAALVKKPGLSKRTVLTHLGLAAGVWLTIPSGTHGQGLEATRVLPAPPGWW